MGYRTDITYDIANISLARTVGFGKNEVVIIPGAIPPLVAPLPRLQGVPSNI